MSSVSVGRTSVRVGIAEFLNSKESDSPYLIKHWSTDLESQVIVNPGNHIIDYENFTGEPSDDCDPNKDDGYYTDGEQTWANHRWPQDAGENPQYRDRPLTYELSEHVALIGTTWWDYVRKCSVAVAFDIDATPGHATTGVDEQTLDAAVEAAGSVPYTAIVKSKSGNGYHVYLFFDPDDLPETANHFEHRDLARFVLAKLSQDTGFDFSQVVDTCGGNDWIWADKIGNNGFQLVQGYSQRLTAADLGEWRKHIPATRVKVGHQVFTVSPEHQKLLDWLSLNGWPLRKHSRPDGSECFGVSAYGLKLAHTALQFRGEFETISTGKERTPNCYIFPNAGGAWWVGRYGTTREPSWKWNESKGQSWTTLNESEEDWAELAARFCGTLKSRDNKRTFQFASYEAANNVLRNFGVTLPPIEDRAIVLTRDGNIVHCEADRHADEDTPEGWIKVTSKRFACSINLPIVEQSDNEAESSTIAADLLQIAQSVELFHDANDNTFVTIPVNGHFETYPTTSRGFRRWLHYQFEQKHGKPPSSQAIADAIASFDATAKYEGKQYKVAVRIQGDDETFYYDLCNPNWEVVEITANGWRIVPCPSHIKFRRPSGMLETPRPTQGGSINSLRQFLNLDDRSWHLYIGFLVAVLRPRGPYPTALFICPSGSAKTTGMRVGKLVVDPHTAPIRIAPKNAEALMIGASNGICMCIDNSSGVADWLADLICGLNTGTGAGNRKLYSDADEQIFNVCSPVAITAIHDVTDRDDFLKRCLLINCNKIEDGDYKSEKEFYEEFEKVRPEIFGALLTAVSAAIRKLPQANKLKAPRMADFFRWVSAAESGLGWEFGAFRKHYDSSRESLSEVVLDNPFCVALRQMVETSGGKWTGTASELLKAITPGDLVPKDWPASSSAVGIRLNRLIEDFGKHKIRIEQGERRVWTLSKFE